MTYDADKPKEIEVPEPGTRIEDAKLQEVKDGKRGDFQHEEFIEKYDLRADDPCIQIKATAKFKGRTVEVKLTMPYTNDEEGAVLFHPMSNLGKFVKWYGQLPKEGMTVTLEANAESYFRLKME